jgi:hypothetical protein
MSPRILAEHLLAAAGAPTNNEAAKTQEITCPECGAKIQTGYETSPETGDTGESDQDNGDSFDVNDSETKQTNLTAALLNSAKVNSERNKLDKQTQHALDAVKAHAKAAKRSAAELLAAAIKAVKDQGKNNKL